VLTVSATRDATGQHRPPDQLWPGSQVIDLSVPLAEDLPCYWPTHLPFQHKLWNWFGTRADGPYTTAWLAIDEHTGTHFDAPHHFVPPPDSGLPDAGPLGAVTAERVPLDQLIGPAAVIDVSALTDRADTPGVSPRVGVTDVTAWEDRHGGLTPGTVVLLRTGWDRFYRRGAAGNAYLHDVVVTRSGPGWPAPAVSTMELLVDRGVRAVGTDAPSIGPADDGRPVHVVGLSAGVVFVECLAGLAELPPRGAWFCFLPLKVERGSGAPGRAVAIRPRPDTD
jgi:isatin hydrolase